MDVATTIAASGAGKQLRYTKTPINKLETTEAMKLKKKRFV
jgi:hypothetical protein